MYHAMFSPQMVVHLVGQQQQQQQYSYSDASNGGSSRQNRIITGNNYGHGPFEQPYPLELLQLMGFDMPPIRSRAYNHPPAGRGGGGWRERGNVHASGNPLMPPPMHVGFRPLVHNNTMKRNYWNKNNGRPLRNSEREGGSEINHSSSSDSGFSSRSPTPNKQQGKELSAGDMSGGENEELDVSNSSTSSADNNKGLKRLHEVYGPQGQNGIGGTHHHGQQHQQEYYQHQQHSSQHSMQALHNLQYYQQQQNMQHGLVRSESPYQTKRRYHSGRHSPPLAAIPPHLQRHPRGGRRLNGMLLGFSSGLGPPYTIAPDRFLSHAHLMQVTETPLQLLNSSDWDKISEGIWNKFMSNQQTEETYRKKMHLWKCLYIYIKTSFPRYGLYLVGSTMNGFGSDNSDVDMCLLVRHSEMDQRNEAVGHLEQLLKYLRHCEFIEHPELIQAKVPILKFRDTHHCLEVDLNCNNAVGIRNTHLLYCYSQLDWRVRPLVLIVKLWAHKHNINDAKNMTISSYSLVLMVIHFLQCGVSPPVLPCLHRMYQGKFTPHSDIQSIDIHEDLRPFKSENAQSLGELLYELLRYYVEFDFSQFAISVRLASRIPIDECRRARSYKNDPHQWKYLCIEEPFDLTNTARSVYDRDVFEKVKAVFHKSYNSLKKNRDIESIFNLDKRD